MSASTLHIPATKMPFQPPQSVEDFAHQEAQDEGKLALDIFETDSALIFLAPVSGVDPKKMNVLVTEDILTISGERTFPEDIFSDEKEAFLEECYWGKFSRSIVLPAAVNSKDAVAKLKNGILIIEVPKAKKAKSKIIPVEVM